MLNKPEINHLQLLESNCLEDSEMIKNTQLHSKLTMNCHNINKKSCESVSIIVLKYRSRGVSCYQYEQSISFPHTFKI